MSVIAVGTWRGTGATTAALALAAAHATSGQRSWMVESDPAGGVLTARCPGWQPRTVGLEEVAFRTDMPDITAVLEAAATPLGQVSVVTNSWDPFQAWSNVASPRVQWADQLRRLGGTVFVDVGSIRNDSPAWSVIEVADALILCTSSEPASLTATVAWMDNRGKVAANARGLASDTSRLLVIDAPLSAGERFDHTVGSEIGSRFAGWWPWEPRVVDHLHRGGSLDHRSIRKFALPRAAVATVAALGIAHEDVA